MKQFKNLFWVVANVLPHASKADILSIRLINAYYLWLAS